MSAARHHSPPPHFPQDMHSSRQRNGLGGANGLSNVGAKLGCRKLAAILRWLRDAYHGPPGPCSDAAGEIETMQRCGSDHQWSRLEEHGLGAPRIAFGARSLTPSPRSGDGTMTLDMRLRSFLPYPRPPRFGVRAEGDGVSLRSVQKPSFVHPAAASRE